MEVHRSVFAIHGFTDMPHILWVMQAEPCDRAKRGSARGNGGSLLKAALWFYLLKYRHSMPEKAGFL
jgi:hypothetical protein